jgi:hypothetical protein
LEECLSKRNATLLLLKYVKEFGAYRVNRLLAYEL